MNCTGDEIQKVEGENASGKTSMWDPNCLGKTGTDERKGVEWLSYLSP